MLTEQRRTGPQVQAGTMEHHSPFKMTAISFFTRLPARKYGRQIQLDLVLVRVRHCLAGGGQGFCEGLIYAL